MNHKIKLSLLSLSILVLFIDGCASLKSRSEKLTGTCAESIETFSAGNSVSGRVIEYTKLGSGSNVILMFASIHGNERAGKPLLNKFQTYLEENCTLLRGKTVIIIPVVNPDGLAKNKRFNINGVDLNRNFPAGNRENDKHGGSFALSEIESYILYRLINTYKPGRVIAFHEALGCIDYDGPAEEFANRLAAKCELPVHKLGARPGSLGSYVGLELNLPIITIELTKDDSKKSADQLWRDYKDMLIESIN